MEESKILVHVGYHKTATTWLQNNLFCKEGLGFSCPWGNQAGVAVDLFICNNPFKFDPAEARKKLEPEIARTHERSVLPVLSNEALCGLENPRTRYERQAADRLKETLPEAHILITIREQRGSILSHYREYISKGNSCSIEEYIGGAAMPPGFYPECQLDRFEYDHLVAYYIKLFGADKVKVILQEDLASNSQAACDDLAVFLGIPRFTAPDRTRDRIGLKGSVLVYKRICNRLGIGIPDWSKPSQSFLYKVLNKFEQLLVKFSPKGINAKIEQGMVKKIAAVCAGRYETSNSNLAAIIGMDLEKYGYKTAEAASSESASQEKAKR